MANYSKELYTSEVGFEFEFLRDDTLNLGTIKKELQKLFKVKISIEKENHSDFVPTEDHWKMEPDFSGGKNLVEVVTAPLPYTKAKMVLMTMLKFIRDTKKISLSDRCGLHINVNLPDPYITHIDLLKYVLDFDESYVYSLFPERQTNIYARSIKSIYPVHTTFNMDNAVLNPANYIYPSTKYYGINFEKLASDYLEFRYIGGKQYAKKSGECMMLMDFFILSLVKSHHNSYNKKHLVNLKSTLAKKDLLFKATRDYFSFKNVFKNLNITADTSSNPEVVKSHFHNIISRIFPILQKMEVINYNMKGNINYDSDECIVEIQGMTLKDTIIDDIKLIIYDSTIIQCVIENVHIRNSKLKQCDLTNVDTDGCDMTKVRLKHGFHSSNVIKDSYINGKLILLESCEIKNKTIFREGKYQFCDIDDSVEMIDAEEIKNND